MAPGVDTKVVRGDHPSMEELPLGAPAKQRAMYRYSGLGGPLVFGVHNNTKLNLRRGLLERVYFVEKEGKLVAPPVPASQEGFSGTLSSFKRRLLPYLPMATRVTPEQFVGRYTGRRATIYAAAVESLARKGVCRKDSYLSTFVKAEKLNLSSKPDPAPRVIQPRHPRYNVEVGRYLAHVEHNVYRAIAEVWGGPTVMKGYNAFGTGRELRAMWDEFAEPVAVGLDASRFDQHVSVEALRWEHSIYLACYAGRDRTELNNLLQWQLRNTGFARASDGGYKYKVNGCRMSGDMNTAMGNCLLMSAMVWAYCQEKRIKARLANNGDDCVVVMDRRHLASFQRDVREWFLRMGFTMKVEAPAYEFEQIEFCQTRPVWTPDGWLMCRDPRVCCSKDVVSVLPLHQGNGAYGLLTAVGQCGLSLAGGVPVLQSFYSAMVVAGRGVQYGHHCQFENGFQRLARGMHLGVREIHPRTRYSFWLAFGIIPEVQMAVEQELEGWTFTPLVLPRASDSDTSAICSPIRA